MKPIKDELNGADFALPSKFFNGELPRNFKRVSRLEEQSIEQKSIAFYKRILESQAIDLQMKLEKRSESHSIFYRR